MSAKSLDKKMIEQVFENKGGQGSLPGMNDVMQYTKQILNQQLILSVNQFKQKQPNANLSVV